MDGSASRDNTGTNRAGYAAVTAHKVFLSEALSSIYSAQAAELVAFTKACELAIDKSAKSGQTPDMLGE